MCFSKSAVKYESLLYILISAGPGGDMQWCFSQVKGAIDDDVAEGMKPVKSKVFL